MKHAFRWFVLVLVAILVTTGTRTASAQANDSASTYRVIRGTTLWDLSAKMHNGNALRWREIYDANVAEGILDPGKLRFNGKREPIVILSVGSTILLNRQAAANAPTMVQEVPQDVVVEEPVSVVSADNSPFWKGMLALLAIAAAIFLVWLLFRKLANPTTSGPAMRQGGINDESSPEYFQAMASQRTGPEGSSNYVPPERIRVVNIRRGRGYGLMQVRYRGRTDLETKRLTGEVVYQATMEYPDGRQETMYCLQACANDLVFVGTRYLADRLFRFEAEGASVYVPPQPTIVNTGASEVRIGDEEITVTHGDRTIAFGADNWTLSKSPDGGLIVAEEGRSPVEFRNGRIYGAEVPKSETSLSVSPSALVDYESDAKQ